MKKIAMPNDVIATGEYKKIGRFDFAQVFFSFANNFTGTEQEFLEQGLAKEYLQISEFKRLVIQNKG